MLSYLTAVCMYSELDVMMCVVSSELRPRGCGDRLCGGRHCVEASLRELLVSFCVDWLLIYVDLVYGIMISIWYYCFYLDTESV